jgi:hypothetical protein
VGPVHISGLRLNLRITSHLSRLWRHGYESLLEEEAVASYPDGVWEVLPDDETSAPVSAVARKNAELETGDPAPDDPSYR